MVFMHYRPLAIYFSQTNGQSKFELHIFRTITLIHAFHSGVTKANVLVGDHLQCLNVKHSGLCVSKKRILATNIRVNTYHIAKNRLV